MILTIDTALGATSLAIGTPDTCVAGHVDETPARQAAMLVTWIRNMMAAHGVGWGDLEAIACSTGPGGFTSVRIGVAAARAMAFAAEIPAYGVPSLEIMAWYAKEERQEDDVTCILPAGNCNAVTQRFRSGRGGMEAVDAPVTVPKDRAAAGARTVCMPEGTIAAPGRMLHYPLARTAQIMLAMCGDMGRYAPPVPLYSRPPDAVPGKPLLDRPSEAGV